MPCIWCYDIVDEVSSQFSHSPLALGLHGPEIGASYSWKEGLVLVSVLSIDNK